MNLKDLFIEGSDWQISLSKLTGSPIKDVCGYLTSEFGDVCFKLTEVIFENNKFLGVEGEHDLPYVVSHRGGELLPDEETLEDLYRQSNEGYEE